MATLAELNREHNWGRSNFSLSNGTFLDSSNCGRKLIEKMGWKEGQGLGRSENGETEFIKVKQKLGNTGIGWDPSEGRESVPCQDDFDSLLKNLRNSHGTSLDGTSSKKQVSLEHKSRMSRKRVHYQKMIRSKDVTQYSSEDKKAVLGKKSPEKRTVDNVSSEKNAKSQKVSSGGPDTLFTSSVDMVEYFAKKSKRRKLNTDEPSVYETPQVNGKAKTCQDGKDFESAKDASNSTFTSEANGTDYKLKKLKRKKSSRSEEQKEKKEESSEAQNFPLSPSSAPAVDSKLVRRKRKKLKKKENKRNKKLETSEISEKSEKESSSSDEKSVNMNGTETSVGKHQSKKRKINPTEDKKHQVTPLKSILKSVDFVASSIKNVSFNEDVLYELIPSRSEDTEVDNDQVDGDEDDSCAKVTEDVTVEPSVEDGIDEIGCNETLEEDEDDDDDSSSDEADSPNSSKSPDSAETSSQDIFSNGTVPIETYMSLPVFNGGGGFTKTSDSWDETLKTAEKMNHYMRAFENMKKHEIFCTTNLFEIRGYGY